MAPDPHHVGLLTVRARAYRTSAELQLNRALFRSALARAALNRAMFCLELLASTVTLGRKTP